MVEGRIVVEQGQKIYDDEAEAAEGNLFKGSVWVRHDLGHSRRTALGLNVVLANSASKYRLQTYAMDIGKNLIATLV